VMARRTLHIPDAIDEQLKADLEHGDSYSAKVQEALTEYYGFEEVEAE